MDHSELSTDQHWRICQLLHAWENMPDESRQQDSFAAMAEVMKQYLPILVDEIKDGFTPWKIVLAEQIAPFATNSSLRFDPEVKSSAVLRGRHILLWWQQDGQHSI